MSAGVLAPNAPSVTPSNATPAEHDNPNVLQLKTMFPDFDHAVLSVCPSWRLQLLMGCHVLGNLY